MSKKKTALKSDDVKSKITKYQWLPHVVAVISFILMPILYMLPLTQGKILNQHDTLMGLYGSKELREYRAEHKEEGLWNPNMFSGMPAFQGNIRHSTSLGTLINKNLRGRMPAPSGIFFILCLSSYIMLLCFGVNPWLSLLAALALGFSTFNVISIDAGHNAKINALSYVPAIIGGVFLSYRKNLLLGGGIVAFAMTGHFYANHFQISYYLFLLLVLYGIFEFSVQLKEKKLANFFKATAMITIIAALAIASNASRILTTMEYAKESTRSGKSELSLNEENKSSGLDKDYAMRWSQGFMETFTYIIPNFMGGASNQKLGDNSNMAKAVSNKRILENAPTYWGNQPGVAGPLYQGALFVFLFILGLVLVRSHLKWWLVTATVLFTLLAYGKNLSLVSDFFFYNVPMYNKFRAPTMIVLFLQFVVPLLGLLAIKEFIEVGRSKNELKKGLYLATGISAGIVVVFGLIGSYMYSFEGAMDESLIANGWPIDALRADRADMLRMDALRSLFFILAGAGILFLFLQNKVSKTVVFAGIGVLLATDMLTVGKRYLTESDYVSERKFDDHFKPDRADQAILADTDPNFRVMNLTVSTFNDASTSYFHKSIGGYHGAKMLRYQELIETQISRNNISVLNMLNTKYFKVQDRNSGQPTVQRNPDALGPVWFVDEVVKVQTADEEIKFLDDFNPSQSTVINAEKFGTYLSDLDVSKDSNSTIEMVEFDVKKIEYKSNVNGDNEHFAVFSEIYYNSGRSYWQAYIDGKEADHVRVNYVLRGMRIPPGVHTITFEFKAPVYYSGLRLSFIFSLILSVFILGAFGWEMKKKISG